MKKIIATAAASAAMLGAIVMPAFAAKPAVDGCFGEDISGYATVGETDPDSFFGFPAKGGWGGFISFVAQIPGADGQVGVGGEINAHQAGLVPDATIVNSCN